MTVMVEMALVVVVAVVVRLQDRWNAIIVVNVVILPEIVDAKEEMTEEEVVVVAEEVTVETEIMIEEETDHATDQEIDVTDLEIVTDVMIVIEGTETEVTIEIDVDVIREVALDTTVVPNLDQDHQAMTEIKEVETVAAVEVTIEMVMRAKTAII